MLRFFLKPDTPTVRRPPQGQVVAAPRRSWTASRLVEPLLLLALFLATLAGRAAVMGSVLINWDAVQYALGLSVFDVVRHQPHPPGSIAYEGLGWLVYQVTGDVNSALAWISVGASALGAVLCYVVGRDMFGRTLGTLGTTLYVTSPLTWFYGAVALPYSLEGAFALGVVWLCWRAMERRSAWPAWAGAALLGAAGGFRPSTITLLLPLWAYATWLAERSHPKVPAAAPAVPAPPTSRPQVSSTGRMLLSPRAEAALRGENERFRMNVGSEPRAAGSNGRSARDEIIEMLAARQPQARQRETRRRVTRLAIGLAVLVVVCALWAGPLIWLTGGLERYLTASRQLTSLASEPTSVVTAGLTGVGANLQYVWEVAAIALNVAGVCFMIYLLPLRRRVRWPWRPTPSETGFLLLGVVPALLLFSLVHIGQAGYLLVVWPLVCFLAAQAALSVAQALGPQLGRAHAAGVPIVSSALCAANVALFVIPPPYLAPDGLSAWAIRENDAEWRELRSLAQGLGPSSAAVLTGTRSSESFRHAGYYLPEMRVYAVGPDREGTLGVAFRTYLGDHDYAEFMAGASASTSETLPAGTRRLLILDKSVAKLFREEQLEPVALTQWRKVWLYPAQTARSPLTTLRFPPQVVVESSSG